MTRNTEEFISQAGWEKAQVAPLAGDASNRRYDRLTAPDGQTAVLMDAPPDRGEDVRPFIKIARYLKDLGLSAPEILRADEAAGLLLIEDLGDRLFAREVRNDPSVERPLYHTAAEVLSVLHRAEPPALAPYDASTTVPLAALAYDWYVQGATGTDSSPAKARFSAIFEPIIASLDSSLSVVILRDYHAENLIWLPDRNGVARVGLLDFQDAMCGHPAYDLVSFLQDARRNVPLSVEDEVKAAFISENQYDAAEFEAAYAIFGLQRNMRILGVFARLCLRDGKSHYVDLIPRVWGHVQTSLRHPSLHKIAPFIAQDLPAPSAQLCASLKEMSGQWAGQ